MSLRKNFKILLTMALASGIIFFAAMGLPFNAYSETPKISKESVDILTKTGQAMADVAAAVKPAVVNVSTSRTIKIPQSDFAPFFNDPFFRRFFGDEFSQRRMPKEHKTASLGSGVIVSPDGYILTNNHVIKDADEIKVLLSDKREFKGTVKGVDPKTDLAVIKIEAANLPVAPWGDSDKLRVGEIVLAIGSPYGLNQTITMGIVSAVGRADVGIADYEDFIQTDAAINPGNSGGAMVNAKGELIGINTAIFSTSGGYQGIGFAIPSNMAKTVMDSLIKKGKVIRGWLGVTIQEVTPELAKQFDLKEGYGALVSDIIEKSPAEQAGIMRGDVIIEIEGKKVDEPDHLRNMVAGTPPGAEINLKVIREGKSKSITVTVGELPAEMQKATGGEYNNVLKGVSVQDLTPEISRQLNIPSRIKGVVITDIAEGSPSEEHLKPEDVLVEINRKKIADVKAYENIVSKIKPKEDLLLTVFRNGATIYIPLSWK
ncbi:MAG: DegQ family serine endoprotease [Nitrospirae bacterium]|nr:DegQ family serine endoprotease [Nitrospirota bacterium]